MPGWGKIAVGVRVTQPDARFFAAWTRMLVSGLRPGDSVLPPAIDLPHHYAAEAIALRFLKGDCDSVLYVDDDMVFAADTLERLRSFEPAQEYDMVQALACSRNGPHFPVVLTRDESTGEFAVMPQPPPHTMVTTSLCGLAFTLIRRAVFERIAATKDPKDFYFYWSRRGDTSEDASFSADATRTGSRVGVCTDVTVGHRVTCTVRYDLDRQGIDISSSNNGVMRLIGDARNA